MSAIGTDVALAAAVLAAWIGCLGFARLRSPFDRVHCVAFVNTASGLAVTLAALLNDGLSPRVGKVVLVVGASLLAGAATSHAIGRMLVRRSLSLDQGSRAVGRVEHG